MTRRVDRLVLLAVLAAVAGCGSAGGAGSGGEGPAGALPPIMVWAWHGEHDLSFLDPAEAGVAFLAGTVRISGEEVTLGPGSGSIAAPAGTLLLPVVRVEVDPARPATLGARQLEEVTAGVRDLAAGPYPGLQLDFDARRSERPFYRRLLAAVRAALGKRFLSVAALASWCLDDPWLPSESVDELVPMLYRMGRDREPIQARLSGGRDFAAGCRTAVGIAAEEPAPQLAGARRLYLWTSDGWNASRYRELRARATA